MKVYKGKPGNMRHALPNFATPIGKAKKSKFKCDGGPYDGESLYLTQGSTAVMTVKGQKGQYIFNQKTKTTEWRTC